jgi:hypothetical protein
MLSKVPFFKSASGAIPTPPSFSVSVSPSSYDTITGKGSTSTPFFTANVSGGTAPYVYLWEATDGSPNTPTSPTTRLTLSGYDEEIVSTLTCTVTDATLAEVSDNASIQITFGS